MSEIGSGPGGYRKLLASRPELRRKRVRNPAAIGTCDGNLVVTRMARRGHQAHRDGERFGGGKPLSVSGFRIRLFHFPNPAASDSRWPLEPNRAADVPLFWDPCFRRGPLANPGN